MDLIYSPQDLLFGEEVRTWLQEHIPSEPRPIDGMEAREFDLAWQHTQYEGGWAGISWPPAFGGRGLSLVQQLIWYTEYALAEAPYVGTCFVGNNHAGPTLIARANDAQRAVELPQILKGEVVWCQGFSEPGAGSDLAGLRTSGRVDGDSIIVTGQKIWSSYAHLADRQELLLRTDSAKPRHRGLTWAICDMRSPGIDIRPIKTMAGIRHFCEVFYNDVTIPIDNVVGTVDDGWSVAMATLSFERGTAFMADQVALAATVERIIDLARTHTGPDGRRPAIADDEIARRLASARAETAALEAMTYATVSRAMRRPEPGPEGSMVRLYYSELNQRVHQLAMDVLGPQSLFPDSESGDSLHWTHNYLESFGRTIGGGTKEVQKNIIGERVLGLPRGPR
jgi:alkylation response protein AidB-like acyl-CoA dehydrogenase